MGTTKDSDKAFNYALITVGLFLVFLLVKYLVGQERIAIEKYSFISAFIMFLVVVSSMIGFFYNIKGIKKDPVNAKKVVSLILNGIFIILFITTTVSNVLDLIDYSKL
ncbi:hypothetical protein [Psychroserpens sp.]|uniref:hypothetical protein n=1 Tax=Psychroserpens sp. TaxID=2020870 RepID=UPI001B24531B|nr:hypothetical protein [Psychroserpens sp.]MBO6606509.1 hypothetical protein [Psychroserpens sp.]MBO6630419.1 hypothetical protein [Psychroserpens sp.]MBO6653213.1 hypothetical protein [Psychroserpens sp.]MBO6680759.1 hypothetical protein [Psychroserpens sp.]MBO6750283.1 hypothetical protein [Psychroserpens sp.]